VFFLSFGLSFSTADGERPALQFAGGELWFSFIDWREQPVRFMASDVCAFSWAEQWDSTGLRDDVTYEVLESDLIRQFCEASAMSPTDGYRHFKLCFNAVGALDLVCKSITVA
jgi:hypothetical protein